MMEVKIQCDCGSKFKFDVEPVNGVMPGLVHCPTCNADATVAANVVISQNRQAALVAPAPPVGGIRLRVAGAAAPTESAESSPALSANRRLLERTTFFIKERVAMLKLTDTYDILDPATGQSIGLAKEEPPGWAKWLRLVVNKQLLPTAVNIYEYDGQPPVLSIRRGFTFLRSKVRVVAGHGESLGYFKSKLLSLGGGFNVFDNADQQVAEVKGNWKGWDFRFLSKSGREIGTVTKKWAGLGKELFTTADNYVISLTDLGGAGQGASALLLAAGLAIDVVFKEQS
jgi:uncharacterized protein YxjI